MKRSIGIGLVTLLLTFVYFTPVNNKELPLVIETQELPQILTRQDYEKLYTCKQDVRKEDKSIVEVDYNDAQLLLCISRAEGGAGLDGQLWVMRTIYNRTIDSRFDDTIQEVVTAPKQFEVYANGMYKDADINANSHLALAMLERGWNETEGALYWRAANGNEGSWHEKNLTYIKEVEGNIFYK